MELFLALTAVLLMDPEGFDELYKLMAVAASEDFSVLLTADGLVLDPDGIFVRHDAYKLVDLLSGENLSHLGSEILVADRDIKGIFRLAQVAGRSIQAPRR